MKNFISFTLLVYLKNSSVRALRILQDVTQSFAPKAHTSVVLVLHSSLLTAEKALFGKSNIFKLNKYNLTSLFKNEKESQKRNNNAKNKIIAESKIELKSKKKLWDLNYAGKIKHYPPANKEWFNSIYAYNHNTLKILPSADKAISKLIKGYFNSYSRELQSKAINKIPRSRRLRVKKARLSTYRMLVSKAELKHTSEKITVTVYVYNNEEKHYLDIIKSMDTIDQIDGFSLGTWTFKEQSDFIASLVNQYILGGWNSYDIEKFGSRGWTLDEIKRFIPAKATLSEIYLFFSQKFRNGLYLKEFPWYLSAIREKENNEVGDIESRNRVLFLKQKLPKPSIPLVKYISLNSLILISKIRNYKKGIHTLLKHKGLEPNKHSVMSRSNLYEMKYFSDYVYKSLRKEIYSVCLKQLIAFSKLKFEKRCVGPLVREVKRIYDKKIEFNFVNLKYLHLNSSIFSETIVTKLRSKQNKLLRVLKNSLLMFELPAINRQAVYDDIYNKKFISQNLGIKDLMVKKPYLQSMAGKVNNNSSKNFYNAPIEAIDVSTWNRLAEINDKNSDVLEKSLLHFMPKPGLSLGYNRATPDVNDHAYRLGNIMNSLKHKSVSGIRLEAAGRLTKRNTAARSVFKVRYKGNIKNIDSSDKGLSTVMLRGHAKSNLQYSILKSKIRIGSFGLKGWVSSS